MVKKNTAGTAADTATQTREQATAGADAGVTAGGPLGAVWEALRVNPGSSVAVIAAAAGVADHTTRRMLAHLETDGRVTRTRGRHAGGKRTPDAWHPATTETDDPDKATNTDQPGPADRADSAPTAEDSPTTSDADATDTTTAPAAESETSADGAARDTAGDNGPGAEAVAVAVARDALTGLGTAINTALRALDAGEGAAALAAGEEIFRGSGTVRRLVRTAINGPVRCASGRVRAQPGQLRDKVAAHLNTYPGKEFTPHEVAKVVGHSAGAISNALDRLVEGGIATITCERPRRFTATPTTPTTGGEAGAGAPAAE